eukprot:SAG22_NODE_1638_length_3912_cov_5.771046_5_plen_90_part_00
MHRAPPSQNVPGLLSWTSHTGGIKKRATGGSIKTAWKKRWLVLQADGIALYYKQPADAVAGKVRTARAANPIGTPASCSGAVLKRPSNF